MKIPKNLVRGARIAGLAAAACVALGGLSAAPAQATQDYRDACVNSGSHQSGYFQVPNAVLSRGSHGACVKELQSDLQFLGVPGSGAPNFVDGSFGPHTEQVVRTFQQQRNVAGGADGKVGNNTWSTLFGLCYVPNIPN